MKSILRVIPKTYKLFLDKSAMKNISPYLNVSSGSYSNVSKVVTYENEKPIVKSTEEGKNQVFVELRDSETGALLGKNRIDYESLPEQSCSFEERISLKNSEGQEIGEAFLEVQVTPRKTGFLGFWGEKPQLESEQAKKIEPEKLEKSEAVKEEEPVRKEEPKKEEATMKAETAAKEAPKGKKAIKSQEIKPEEVAVEEEFPMARDIFYDFERSRRDMDRVFRNFENIFGDRVFSGFNDEFRRVMRTFDRMEREMFRDFDDFMLPFRRRRYMLEEEQPAKRGRGEEKLESKEASQKEQKKEAKESKKEASA